MAMGKNMDNFTREVKFIKIIKWKLQNKTMQYLKLVI